MRIDRSGKSKFTRDTTARQVIELERTGTTGTALFGLSAGTGSPTFSIEKSGGSSGVFLADTGAIEKALSITGGTPSTVIVNAGDDNVDFRVAGETNDHLLFADASTDQVHIGGTGGGGLLNLLGATAVDVAHLIEEKKWGLAGGQLRIHGQTNETVGTTVEAILPISSRMHLAWVVARDNGAGSDIWAGLIAYGNLSSHTVTTLANFINGSPTTPTFSITTNTSLDIQFTPGPDTYNVRAYGIGMSE